LPGFSTAKEVTQISGRGVGLDVVKSMVQEVGGSIRIRSRLGEGSTFELELPLTRSVVRTLVVEVAEEPFAIPLARIDRALFLDRKEIALAENRQYFTSADGNVGLVSARQLLGFGEPEEKEERLAIVVLSDAHDRYGLVVDRFVGEQDLVVRPIDPRLGKIADVDAVAILPDGSPVLIVDVEDAVRSIDNLLTGGRLHKVAAGEEGEEKRRKRILVVDDSITVREVQRHILENQGYEVEVAVDGMDGWNAVRTGSYDLVISDVDMPRMTGIELVGEMKKDPQLRALPVMIVSYKDREEDRLRGLEAGASYYLTKGSFHDETMINAVVDLIGKATS
jgi:two-component system sensor histidine kinase and response regulator WspE